MKTDHRLELLEFRETGFEPSNTEKDIISHCRDNLTNYKVPKLVEILAPTLQNGQCANHANEHAHTGNGSTMLEKKSPTTSSRGRNGSRRGPA